MTPWHKARLIAAGAVGNALEFYDFVVFGFLAVQIGGAFFPAGDPVAALLATFGAFAAGMVMRPVGGMVLGGLADRISRRHALILSVGLIALPTFLIGLLPTYDQVGLLAPVLLVALRMVQGLSVGGEFPTSVVWLVEQAPPGRRGLFGSFAFTGAVLGMLTGTSVCWLVREAVGPEAMRDWGWRMPFLGSLVLTGIAVLLRRVVQEERGPERDRSPVREVLRDSPNTLLAIFLATGSAGCTAFIVLMFIVPWLMQTAGMAYPQALAINIESLALLVLYYPLAGLAADRFGARRVMLAGFVLLMAAAIPCLMLMQTGRPGLDQLGEAVLMAAVALSLIPIGPLMVDAFPAGTRVTGIGIAYGGAMGVFGGFAPIVVQWLMHATGDEMAPAHAVIGVAAVSALAVLLAPCFRPARRLAAQPAE